MAGLLTAFLGWCVIAVPAGWLFAFVEGRINQAPRRTTSAILLSVFLGPLGWIILACRSALTYTNEKRADDRAQAEAARQYLRQNNPTQQ
jgi:hypothetical protein